MVQRIIVQAVDRGQLIVDQASRVSQISIEKVAENGIQVSRDSNNIVHLSVALNDPTQLFVTSQGQSLDFSVERQDAYAIEVKTGAVVVSQVSLNDILTMLEGYEEFLDYPLENHMVLTSTTDGTRRWSDLGDISLTVQHSLVDKGKVVVFDSVNNNLWYRTNAEHVLDIWGGTANYMPALDAISGLLRDTILYSDPTTGNLYIDHTHKLIFGTNGLEIYHTDSHGYINTVVGSLYIRQSNQNSVIIDATNATFTRNVLLGDAYSVKLGSDQDTSLIHNGTDFTVTTVTGNTLLKSGSTTGFKMDTSGKLFFPVDNPQSTTAAKFLTYDTNGEVKCRTLAQAKTDLDVFSQTNWELIGRCGFMTTPETTISFNDSTYEFTLTVLSDTWRYYRGGTLNTITGSKSVRLTTSGTPAKGTYYIYIDSNDGTLISSTVVWTLEDLKIPVAYVVWDDALTPKYFLADERHTCGIDRRYHWEHHYADGSEFISGGVLSGYSVAPVSPTTVNNTFAISQGIMADEDLKIVMAELSDPAGAVDAYMGMYKSGGNWVWDHFEVPYRYTSSGYIQWDNAGTMTEGTNAKFYNTYLLFTNLQGDGRFIMVHGKAQFTTLSSAQAEDPSAFSWAGFPITESVIGWGFTWETNSSYSSLGKCRLAAEPRRIRVATTTSGVTSTVYHNLTLGLQGGDVVLNEFYHLTDLEYTGTGTSVFVRKTDPTFTNSITLNNAAAASTDTDKFAVIDSGVIKYRTGANVWADINSGLFTQGSVLFAGVSGEITQDNSKFFFDNAADYLGLGTDSPTQKFHITSGAVGGTSILLQNTDTGGRAFRWTSTGSSNTTGAGTMSLYDQTGSAYRLVVNSSGYIGIGTISPDAKFTVSNNTGISAAPLSTTVIHAVGVDTSNAAVFVDAFGGVAGLTFRRSEGTAVSPSANTGTIGQIVWLGYGATAYQAASTAKISVLADETFTDSTGASSMLFYTRTSGTLTSAERMRILSSGNIVIGGTTDNGYKLGVTGTGYFSSTLTIGSIANLSNGSSFLVSDSGLVKYRTLSSGAELLPTGTEGQTLYNNAGTWTAHSGVYWDDVNSRLGVGTISPTVKVEVTGDIRYSGNLYSADGTASLPSIRFWNSATGLYNVAGDLGISTDGVSRIYIKTSTGNVLIGTTTDASEKLYVSGNILVTNNNFFKAKSLAGTGYKLAGITDGNVVQIGAIDYTTAGTNIVGGDNLSFIMGGASGTERARFATSTGNFLIGTTADGGYKLTIRTGVSDYTKVLSYGTSVGGEWGAITINTASPYETIYTSAGGHTFSGGNVLIGYTSNPSSYKFAVNGNSYFNGNMTVESYLKAWNFYIYYKGETHTTPSQIPSDYSFGFVDNDANYPNTYGSLFSYRNSNNGYGYSWQLFKGWGAAGYGSTSSDLYFRSAKTDNTWIAWTKLLSAGNISDYYSSINYWTKTGDNLFYSTGYVQVTGFPFFANNNAKNGFVLNSAGTYYGTIQNDAADKWSLGYTNALATLGTPVLTWTSSGNVGIGTTAPVSKLQVKGDTYKEIQIGSTAGVLSTVTYFTDLVTLGSVINLARPTDGAFVHSIFTYNTTGNTLENLGIASRSDLKIVVGATADLGMIIKNDGKVGIGTTGPNQKLQINGITYFAGVTTYAEDGTYAIFGRQDSTARSHSITGRSDTTAANNYLAFNIHDTATTTSRTEVIRILGSGNVGIGDTNPGAKLTVSGALNAGVALSIISNQTGGSQEIFRVSHTGSGVNDGWLQIKEAAVTKVNIAANNSRGGDTYFNGGGNVGIGTNAPVSRLDILGHELRLGSNYTDQTIRTNSAVKYAMISTPHYSTSEEYVQWGYYYISDTVNALNIGGGSSSFNAATSISFHTAATNTTTGGTLRMKILGDGGLKIEDYQPSDTSMALYRSGSNLYWNGSALATGSSVSGTTGYVPKFTSSSALGNSVIFDNAGKIGIGITDSGYPLIIQSAAGAQALALVGRSGDNISSFEFHDNARTVANYIQGNSSWIRMRADGGFHFRSGGTPTVTDTDGFTIEELNVGIGTSAPGYLLHLSGVSPELMIQDTRAYSGGTGANVGFTLNTNTGVNSRLAVIGGSKENTTAGDLKGLIYFYTHTGSSLTEKMRIDSSGNVGIGKTPSVKLDIEGATYVNNGRFGVYTGAGVAAYATFGSSATNTFYVGVDNSSGNELISTLTASGAFIWDASNFPISFGTNNLLRLTILADGGLKFGDYQPATTSYALYRNGSGLYWNGSLLATGASISGTAGRVAYLDSASSVTHTGMYWDNGNGRLGIGAATPSGKLEVAGDIVLSQPSHTDKTYVFMSSNHNTYIDFASGYHLYIRSKVGATDVMAILDSGNVGIGTTTPKALIDSYLTTSTAVNAPAASGTTPNNAIGRFTSVRGQVLDIGSQHTGDYAIWLQVSDKGNLSVPYSLLLQPNGGNVGIGCTSVNAKLQVNGAVYANATETDTVSPQTNNGTFVGNNGYWQLRGTTNHSVSLDVYNGGSALAAMTILQSGNVGIGTISPASKLDIVIPYAKTDITGRVVTLLARSNDASNYSALQLIQTGAATAADRNWRFQTIEDGVANAGSISFQTSGGNVGIGTTGPVSPLHIAFSSAKTTLGDSRRLILDDLRGGVTERTEIGFGYIGTYQPGIIGYITTDATASTKGDIYFATRSATTNTAPVEIMRITSAGKVNINDTSNTTYQLYVSGTIGTTGQFTSTLADGTAPFVVTSTTVCSNLNAGKVDGYDLSGTQNTIAKWGATSLGNSVITDDGSAVEVAGHLSIKGVSNNAKRLTLYNGPNTYYIAFSTPAISANSVYDLPTAKPGVDGYVLSCTTGGVMSWVAQNAGTVTGTATIGYLPKMSTTSAITTSQIADDGNYVNIGTSGQAYKLYVNGTFYTANNSFLAGTVTVVGEYNIEFASGTASPRYLRIADRSSGTAYSLFIAAQSHTGTTSTGGNLYLQPGTGTSTNGTVYLGYNGSTNFTSYITAYSRFRYASSVMYQEIDTGTATDFYIQSVSGTAQWLRGNASGGTQLLYGTGWKLQTVSGGVQVNGTLSAATDVEASASVSDQRMKTDLVKITNGLDIIRLMNPVEYTALYPHYYGQRHSGLIAQEVQRLIPSAVWERQDGLLGLRDERITPFLVSAIQKVDSEVEYLKKRVLQLEEEVASLRGRDN